MTRFRGAAFRVAPLWVGVLALVGVFDLVVGVFDLVVGVFALDVGVPARDVRPFTCGLLTVGEFDLDEGAESLGLFKFLTERGSFDDDPVVEVLVVGCFREGAFRETGSSAGDLGTSLWDLL